MSSLYTARNSNLSLAWAEVFLKLMERGVNKLSPVVVTVGEFDATSLPVEHEAVRDALDTIIDQSCRTVASTIFPNSLWLPAAQGDAQLLYDRYAKVWPRVAKHHSNRNGVYFRRLTAYLPKTTTEGVLPVNQLQHIIATYRGGNHRHSALQASIFDPTRDHTKRAAARFPLSSAGCLWSRRWPPGGDRLLRPSAPYFESLRKLSGSVLAGAFHGAANGSDAFAGYLRGVTS